MPKVIWWGHSDLNYSRNRICRQLLQSLGYELIDFSPHISALADIEAHLIGLPLADLVWVPCFRHRDVVAATRWARQKHIPVLFDPLISAWQKRVYERRKYAAGSAAAQRWLAREIRWLQAVDMVLLDTEPQRQMFIQRFKLEPAKTACVYVGAEQPLFAPLAVVKQPSGPVEVLFYGSFIALHGVNTVIEAARLLAGQPHIQWVLLGEGSAKASAQQQAAGLTNVSFESSVPYAQLPRRIAQADIVLGVFGDSQKSSQVIPNKVFQALACARPVITRTSLAYPTEDSRLLKGGLVQIEAANPVALAQAVAQWASCSREQRSPARAVYDTYFSEVKLQQQLLAALASMGLSAGQA
ncbi:Glycosyltransferase involved in cell wall bisynthesis [Methylophilus rhizosphaerae]|uniref:Glycosyltransferase involved in cell wall bisynthesis n=1 Tax=Methylophilus rhizosphaerae TaxID=492660 RepID=A0A1G9DCR4_9PROT|nr:glycosyltransferase [Methylophilus rhizosphaerae]SDK61682.1 Glycosyltransferase involved in cell wall bisynthesis [Methylophilus rhizosphaerae]